MDFSSKLSSYGQGWAFFGRSMWVVCKIIYAKTAFRSRTGTSLIFFNILNVFSARHGHDRFCGRHGPIVIVRPTASATSSSTWFRFGGHMRPWSLIWLSKMPMRIAGGGMLMTDGWRWMSEYWNIIVIWVCLKMGYTPNYYSHLVGIMISKTIGCRGTNLFSDIYSGFSH